MFKKYSQILSNPLLYYSDKSGNSVFRNFCLFNQTGCVYKANFSKKDVGRTLEYRMQLDKYLKFAYFITPIILYFIFIHIKFSMLNLLFFEALWLLIVNGVRIWCSYIYSSHLLMKFGKYELCDFMPDIPQRKKDEFLALFKSKIALIAILVVLFFIPALLVQYLIKLDVNSGKKYPQAVSLSNFYLSIYPGSERIYDMRALARAATRDYEGALKDYKSALDMSGKRFSKRDYTRFENLLYLQKKMTTPTDAVDVFNEYLTKKSLSSLETSQMLWIKSIFKIENNIPEGVIDEYDEIINSLDKNDTQNQFYLSCDKAYMLYIMQEYSSAVSVYNMLIAFAQHNPEKYAKDLTRLYVERGFAKRQMGDNQGAENDFLSSELKSSELNSYEPTYTNQVFVVEKF